MITKQLETQIIRDRLLEKVQAIKDAQLQGTSTLFIESRNMTHLMSNTKGDIKYLINLQRALHIFMD